MIKFSLKNIINFIPFVIKSVLYCFLFFLIVILLKFHFYEHEINSIYDFKNHKIIKKDLLDRRYYLLNRTLNVNVGDKLSANSGLFNSSTIKSEWDLVTYSMLSLALTNISIRYEDELNKTKDYIKELLEHVLDKSFQEFENNHFGEYPLDALNGENIHIAYLAHLNLILGSYKRVGGNGYDDLYDKINESLVKKYEKLVGICTPTYPNQYYFPDNIAAISSISIYSKLNNNIYKDFLDKWIALYKEKENNNKYKLLPFWQDKDCNFKGFPRASSSFWNIYFLSFIDFDWAKKEYQKAKEVFYNDKFFKGFREAPKGIKFYGDVDSGPAIFGLSPSGNGFAISSATLFNDQNILENLLKLSEFVGTSISTNKGKRYSLSPLVGDSIILAMRTAIRWF